MDFVPVDPTYQHPVQIGGATFLLRTFSALAWAQIRKEIGAFVSTRLAMSRARADADRLAAQLRDGGDGACDPKALRQAAEAAQQQLMDAAFAYAEASCAMLRHGLVGWEAWPAPFAADAKGNAADAAVASLPSHFATVLAHELYDLNSASVVGLGKPKSPSVYDWGSSSETKRQPSLDAQAAGEPGATAATTPAS